MLWCIETPSDFLAHVVKVDVLEARQKPADLRSAFHAATSLVSLRDWVLATHSGTDWVLAGVAKGQLENSRKGRGQFQAYLEAHSSDIRIVTAIANASKHMHLEERSKLDGIATASDVGIRQVARPFGTAPFGVSPFGGAMTTMCVFVEGEVLGVHGCLASALDVWHRLFEENGW